MINIRKAEERGHFEHGWLSTWHTFSFARYLDRAQMGFRSLRVINEDRVQAGQGFDTHPHQDMEIITYVLEGALEHKDSMGNGSIIRPGDVQRMSAGTGVTHSEFNHSKEFGVHLLQIWILPETRALEPSYEQKHFPESEKLGKLRLIGSRDGREGSVTIHQDVNIHAAILDADETLSYANKSDRHAWIQIARGAIGLDTSILPAGTGIAVSGEENLELIATERSEILLFDLA